MFRRVAAIVVALGVVPIASGSATEPDYVEVRIAKTKRFVIAFGEAHTASVAVRLFKEKQAGSILLARKRADVEDASYRARFDRPQRGTCRVVVRTPNSRDEETFPCYIPDFGMGTATLTSVTTAAQIEIGALIADDGDERAYGLMYRPRMRRDLGMAFIYASDTEGAFWMKNTLIPLSIAFFDSNGIILRIMDMEPCAEDPCPVYDPEVAYRGALEVNHGAFEDWGIAEGDHIVVTQEP